MARRLACLLFAISLIYAGTHHTLHTMFNQLASSLPSIASTLLMLASIILLGALFFGILATTSLHAYLTRWISRPVRWVFRMLPENHPALQYIALNLSANMIGVGNAATPSGIQAMHALQEDNPTPERATNAMCLLLAMNTSSVQLLPLTVIAVLAATGNTHPWQWWPSMMIATSTTTVFAIVSARLMSRFSKGRS